MESDIDIPNLILVIEYIILLNTHLQKVKKIIINK